MPVTTYLHANGSASNDQDYQVVLEAYFNPQTGLTSQSLWRELGASVRTSQIKMCHSMIPKGFLEQDTLDDSFAILLLSMKTPTRTNPNKHTLIGFAVLEYDSDEPKEIYLNALCGNTDVRNKVPERVSAGRILMTQIEWMARQLGFSILKLSALGYVINYYRRLGFRHVENCSTGESGLARKSRKRNKAGEAKAVDPVREYDNSILEGAERFAGNRFKSDDELEQVYLIEVAKRSELLGTKEEKLNYMMARLNELFSARDTSFRVEKGKIIPLNNKGEVDQKLVKLLQMDDTGTASFIDNLRRQGFAVECDESNRGQRDGVKKNSDGELIMTCDSDGYAMRKCLAKFPVPPANTMPGRNKYKRSVVKSMSGGKRKSVPWKGWSKQSPNTRQRRTMKKRCGKKCFLGPKISFPVCKKNTCTVSSKGLWAAYIRANEWGKPRRSYKGKSRPRHNRSVYKRVSRKAKRALKKRGFKVGKSTRKRSRRR